MSFNRSLNTKPPFAPAPFAASAVPSGPSDRRRRFSPSGPVRPRSAFFRGAFFDKWGGKIYTNWANGTGEEPK